MRSELSCRSALIQMASAGLHIDAVWLEVTRLALSSFGSWTSTKVCVRQLLRPAVLYQLLLVT